MTEDTLQAESESPPTDGPNSEREWISVRPQVWDDVLGLAVNYFARTATWQHSREALLDKEDRDDSDSQPEDRKAAIRALLADSDDLVSITGEIVEQANFKYQRQRVEHIGNLRGRLDVIAYARSRNRREVPRRYPVQEINRVPDTPENLLAATAVLATLGLLTDARRADFVPSGGPERRALDGQIEDLTRLNNLPSLRGLRKRALRVIAYAQELRLTEMVQGRIDGGHVLVSCYDDLVGWARRALLRRALLQAGQEPAAVYGSDFDNQLFELWVLAKTIQAISARLGPPSYADYEMNATTGTVPWAQWADGRWSVWYQTNLKHLGVGPTGWTLGGRPDISIRFSDADRQCLMLVDAKRRSPVGRPTELLYKMLGYFENLPEVEPCLGAIVYFNPEGLVREAASSRDRSMHFHAATPSNRRRGRLLGVGTSPLDTPGTQEGFDAIVKAIFDARNGLI